MSQASKNNRTPDGVPPQRAGLMRRQLLKGGAAAAPALLALKSTPVLAANCTQPSGFSASGNLSRNGGSGCAAPGSLPSVWAGKITDGKYTGTNLTPGTMFNSPAAGFNLGGSYSTDITLAAALALGNGHVRALIVAALLDAAVAGGTGYPDIATVRLLWNNGVVGSGYQPTTSSTVLWGEAQVLTYLKYLSGQATP